MGEWVQVRRQRIRDQCLLEFDPLLLGFLFKLRDSGAISSGRADIISDSRGTPTEMVMPACRAKERITSGLPQRLCFIFLFQVR